MPYPPNTLPNRWGSQSYYPPQALHYQSLGFIKKLIWLYIILLLFEGALRKWVFPGFSDWLLLIRDPVVIVIYLFALTKGIFPFNGFIALLSGLAVLAFLGALCADELHLVVLIYGMRANFLHIPLIFLMASVLDREDIFRIGRFFLWVCIPMTALIIYQFYSPIEARVNRLPGGGIGGIFGAKGHFRPSATFSFVNGIASFYPLATAFLLEQFIGKKRFHWLILAAFAAAIFCAIPFSISRQNALACGLVVAASVPAALLCGKNNRYIARLIIGGGLTVFFLSFAPFLMDGLNIFATRWDNAAQESTGGVQTAIIDRYLNYFLEPLLVDAPLFGYGIGMGSNAGAKFLTGKVGFLLAEGEWSRIILEMGFIIGWLFILYRCLLVAYLGTTSLKAAKTNKDPLPLLLFGACLPLILNGQWNPPTLLGFSIVSGGLCLAASFHSSQTHPAYAPTPSYSPRRQLHRR